MSEPVRSFALRLDSCFLCDVATTKPFGESGQVIMLADGKLTTAVRHVTMERIPILPVVFGLPSIPCRVSQRELGSKGGI